MKQFFVLYQKDLRLFFRQPLTFVFLAVLGVFNSWIFLNIFFLNNQATLQPLWQNLPFFLVFLAPLIATAVNGEENGTGSWEILASLPLPETTIVLAKFAAGFSLLALAIIETLPLAITTIFLGKPDLGIIASGYLGSLLLGAAYLIASLFIASLSRQNLANFFLGFILLLGNNLLGQEFVLMRIPPQMAAVSRYLSLSSHYHNLSQGLLTLRDAVFITSWLIVFMLLTFLA